MLSSVFINKKTTFRIKVIVEKKVEPPAGVEPATYGLQIRCSTS